MTAVAYALSTEARIKTRLGITSAGFDTLIKRLLYGVTDFIEDQCGGRRFLRTTYTNEIYDGGDGSQKLLILRNAPVSTITSFQYRTGTKSSPTWVDFNADSYEEDDDRGVIEVALPKGRRNIRVTYTAGYLIDFSNEFDDAQHTLPYDISDLAEALVTRRFKKRDDEGKESVAFESSTTTWTKQLLDETDREVIANYRRNFIA